MFPYLNVAGSTSRRALRTGRWRKVRLRTRRLSWWEAGLSLREKEGRRPSSARLRRLSRMRRVEASLINDLRTSPTESLQQISAFHGKIRVTSG